MEPTTADHDTGPSGDTAREGEHSGAVALAVGVAAEDWTGDAQFHEYSAAVDPIGSGAISTVPVRRFSAPTASATVIEALDLSADLMTTYPATGPSLLARFVSIAAGDSVELAPNATSCLCYCLRGRGSTRLGGPRPGSVAWKTGDVVTLPGAAARHHAEEHAVLYVVDDSPLLAYLGVTPNVARFAPTRYDGDEARARLAAVASEPEATSRNRIAVLLGNTRNDQTLTATHTLWAMLGILPTDSVQRPHRHQSIALDLIVDCQPGCYTLVGAEVDDAGEIVDAQRVDWEPGGAFVTPPGLWHSHHNKSGAPAHLFPVQDAGLHAYLRTLDIRFSPR